jgi:poly [ADP-ribose] polymerase
MEESMQSKEFPSAGETFLLKKEREKLKKGYVYPKTIGNVAKDASKVVATNSLEVIAKQQLAKNNNPQLSKLIDRLVKANIHNITSHTNIKYNAGTGLFQTPLGIITKEGIDEARNLLVEIKKSLKKESNLKTLASQYLMIIPQDIGVKFDVKAIFPDDDAIQKQANILDSLEASYQSVVSNPVADDGKPAPVEKVFEVDLDVLNDDKERKRLVDYYESSKKRMHGYDHVKVREIFAVKIHDMDKGFNRSLAPIQEVYHGTSQANLLSILKSGLKVSPPSTAYIAGKMFGNGIYGAINSSKSLGYTYGRWGGSSGDSGWLFVCDFAMGKIHRPNGTCSHPASGCDSVWAESKRCGLHHDELIIYKNNQVNVKYLLECK